MRATIRWTLVGLVAVLWVRAGGAYAGDDSTTDGVHYHCSYDGEWIARVTDNRSRRGGMQIELFRLDKKATKNWKKTIYPGQQDKTSLDLDGSGASVEGIAFLEAGAYLMVVYRGTEKGNDTDPVVAIVEAATGRTRTVRRRELRRALSRPDAWVPRMRDSAPDVEAQANHSWFERRRPFVVDEATHQVFMVARVPDTDRRGKANPTRRGKSDGGGQKMDGVVALDYRKGTLEAVEGSSWMSILIDLQGYGPRIDPVRTFEHFGFELPYARSLLADPWSGRRRQQPAVARFRQAVPGVSPQAPSKATGPWLLYLGAPRTGPVEVIGWTPSNVVLLMPQRTRDAWKVVALSSTTEDGKLWEATSIRLPSCPERCLLDADCRYLVTLDSHASIGSGRHTIGLHDLLKRRSRYYILDDFLTIPEVARLPADEKVRLWRLPDNRNLILKGADFSTVWNSPQPHAREEWIWWMPPIEINVVEELLARAKE